MKEIEIGKIVTAVGIKGEVKFYSFPMIQWNLQSLSIFMSERIRQGMIVEKVRVAQGEYSSA